MPKLVLTSRVHYDAHREQWICTRCDYARAQRNLAPKLAILGETFYAYGYCEVCIADVAEQFGLDSDAVFFLPRITREHRSLRHSVIEFFSMLYGKGNIVRETIPLKEEEECQT